MVSDPWTQLVLRGRNGRYMVGNLPAQNSRRLRLFGPLLDRARRELEASQASQSS